MIKIKNLLIKEVLISVVVSVVTIAIPVIHTFAKDNKINIVSTAFIVNNQYVSQQIIGDFINPDKDVFYLSNAQITKTSKQSVPVQARESLTSIIGIPVSFSIPRIGINTSFEYKGLTKEGAVGAPDSSWTVSWFTRGPRPGQPGSAVVSGHSGIWQNGTRAIFDNLPTLKTGDRIIITDDVGIKRTFKVVKTKVYGKDENVPEIFSASSTSKVNIITCYGTWLPSEKTYSHRWVVFTELEE